MYRSMPAGGAQQPLRLRLLLGVTLLLNYQQLKHPRPAARISRIGFLVLIACCFLIFLQNRIFAIHVYAKPSFLHGELFFY